ncbi:PspA/IM30 family protein [Aurantiacibacter zhengii]|nr:PspA/IM30 family protein [Aurantiacibacter zhengii]
MFERAKRVGQLVTSNVESLLDKASDPRKMLLLMRSEIEDGLVALQGERTKAARKAERLSTNAKAKADGAEEWTAKAKVALDKGREDLARSALMAREGDRKLAAQLEAEARDARAEVSEIEKAIAELEAKRAETQAKLDAMPAPVKASVGAAPTRSSKAESRLDNVEAMERRMDFSASRAEQASPVDVDAEIARLQQESAIEAELAAMAGKGKRAKR